MKNYILKDCFGTELYKSEKKSDLFKRLNKNLINWGEKYTTKKQLEEDGFYILTNN